MPHWQSIKSFMTGKISKDIERYYLVWKSNEGHVGHIDNNIKLTLIFS